jgi:hypothetical protein
MSAAVHLPYVARALRRFAVAFLLAGLAAGAAQAELTPLRILVRADDAKFIGGGVGGLNVTVRDADSGALLGGGVIAGGTGDTALLMETAQTRGDTAVNDESGDLRLNLDIERPTRIDVTATGPLGSAQSRQRVSTTLWLLPGQDRATKPLVLALNGLLLDLVEQRVDGRAIGVTAHVAMLCGCGITEDGLWRADDFSVTAVLYGAAGEVLRVPLAFSGEVSRYATTFEAPAVGSFELELQALQHSTGNAGVLRRVIEIVD